MLAHRGRHCRVRDLILPGPAWGSGDQPVECDADERAVLPMLRGSFDDESSSASRATRVNAASFLGSRVTYAVVGSPCASG